MNKVTKFLLGLNIVVCLSTWGISSIYYPKLPDRVPIHFGSSGKPTTWVRKSPLVLLLLPLLSLGLCIGGIVPYIRNISSIKKIQEPKNRENEVRKCDLLCRRYLFMFLILNFVVMYIELMSNKVALGEIDRIIFSDYIPLVILPIIIIGEIVFHSLLKKCGKTEDSIGWGRFG